MLSKCRSYHTRPATMSSGSAQHIFLCDLHHAIKPVFSDGLLNCCVSAHLIKLSLRFHVSQSIQFHRATSKSNILNCYQMPRHIRINSLRPEVISMEHYRITHPIFSLAQITFQSLRTDIQSTSNFIGTKFTRSSHIFS